jgi:sterol desaturase/sphingolipid hydroxylase (fatty acid hydroxylase superfamily)
MTLAFLILSSLVLVALIQLIDKHLAGKTRPLVLGVLVVSSLVPALVYHLTVMAMIQFACFLLVSVLERIAPRNRYEFTGQDNQRAATYNLLRHALHIAFLGGLVPMLHLRLPGLRLDARGVPVWVQGIGFLVAWDAKEYVIHWASHRFDWLWRFHKVHHSSLEITALAWARISFVEDVFRMASTVVMIGLLGIGPAATAAYGGIITLLASIVGHANLDVPRAGTRPIWAYLIMSPAFHGYHHVEGYRGNYALLSPIWDVMFGTFQLPATKPTKFGIGEPQFSRQGWVDDQLATVSPRAREPAPDAVTGRQACG